MTCCGTRQLNDVDKSLEVFTRVCFVEHQFVQFWEKDFSIRTNFVLDFNYIENDTIVPIENVNAVRTNFVMWCDVMCHCFCLVSHAGRVKQHHHQIENVEKQFCFKCKHQWRKVVSFLQCVICCSFLFIKSLDVVLKSIGHVCNGTDVKTISNVLEFMIRFLIIPEFTGWNSHTLFPFSHVSFLFVFTSEMFGHGKIFTIDPIQFHGMEINKLNLNLHKVFDKNFVSLNDTFVYRLEFGKNYGGCCERQCFVKMLKFEMFISWFFVNSSSL